MNYQILLSFTPFVFILFLNLSIFSILSKRLKNNSLFLLLSVFSATPLIMGLLLYFLFFAFPGQENHFYILAISLPTLLLALWARKNIFLALNVICAKWRIIKTIHFDLFSKIILIAILFVIALTFLRTVFWPINWDDQIYYLKQAYVFSQTRSLDLFFDWGFYRDSQVYITQMNPAIRPGLPMIFTTTFFFNNSLRDAIFFCQTIIFYYFLITSSVIFYVSWQIAKKEKLKHALIALFLTLFTYHFIYLSISGFKELLIIPPAILMLFLISNQDSLKKIKPLIYIGVLAGLISFVNYSGTLMTLFIITILIFSKKISIKKIITTIQIILIAILFSGFELLAFSSFAMPSFSNYIPLVENTKKEKTTPQKPVNELASSPKISRGFSIDSFSPEAKKEFAKYNITSLKDLYIKGKFQGFFQIQYFGIIFSLFAVILMIRFKDIIGNKFIKHIVCFLLFYAFVFFDPLNINKSKFAYVLSISHKYTTLLIPFIAIVIAYQFNWIQKISKRIHLNTLFLVTSSVFIVDYFFVKNHPDKLLKVLSISLPIINSEEYYIQKIISLNNLLLIMSGVLLSLFMYGYLINKKRLHYLFKETHIVMISSLFIFFAFPFLFFYNSNVGLMNTFLYSFSKTETKLEKIKGWEEKYSPLKELNQLPNDRKILFIDQPIKLIDIYLDFPKSNIYKKGDLPEKNFSAIKQLDIGYIYAKNDSELNNTSLIEFAELKFKKQIGSNIIFEIKP